jgi:transposase
MHLQTCQCLLPPQSNQGMALSDIEYADNVAFVAKSRPGALTYHGHDIVFTPPYHSNLQPIELVWANTKGEVGRQYDTQTTFKDVRQHPEVFLL